MKLNEYMLAVGEQAVTRLDLLNEINGPYTLAFLNKLDIKPGMTILDVGCGTGNISLWLANKVGKQGRVIGVDISQDQLEIAQKRASAQNLGNLEFICLSIYDLEKLQQQFDIVFSRFLLMHLNKPEEALLQMHKCVKVDGVLACDDHDLSAIESFPPSKAYARLKELTYQVAQKNGLDFDIGKSLYKLYKQLGYSNIDLQVVQPVLAAPRQKMLHPLFFVEVKESFLASGLITEKEYDALIEELFSLTKEDFTYILAARNFQIFGKKSGS